MTVETKPSDQAAYRWNITLLVKTNHDSPTAPTHEVHRTVTNADDLVDVVLRSSYDPRIVAYHYERKPGLDLSAAPTACPDCDEPYDKPPPQQRWHGRECGGHITLRCTSCGQEQTYPPPGTGCR